MITERKKRPKPEDFIGWKSEDGRLEVNVRVDEQSKGTDYQYDIIFSKAWTMAMLH